MLRVHTFLRVIHNVECRLSQEGLSPLSVGRQTFFKNVCNYLKYFGDLLKRREILCNQTLYVNETTGKFRRTEKMLNKHETAG